MTRSYRLVRRALTGIVFVVLLVAAPSALAGLAGPDQRPADTIGSGNSDDVPLSRPTPTRAADFGVAARTVALESFRTQMSLVRQGATSELVAATQAQLAEGVASRAAYTAAAKRAAAAGKIRDTFIWPTWGLLTGWFAEPRPGHLHAGIDIASAPGTPILAVFGGKVTEVVADAGYDGYGHKVVVDHGNGIQTLYAHFDQIDVVAGQDVVQGQALGAMGCTGRCTGSHLHFEVRVGGQAVDPLTYLPPA